MDLYMPGIHDISVDAPAMQGCLCILQKPLYIWLQVIHGHNNVKSFTTWMKTLGVMRTSQSTQHQSGYHDDEQCGGLNSVVLDLDDQPIGNRASQPDRKLHCLHVTLLALHQHPHTQ